MKKYILALIPTTLLIAGPVVAPLIDYDQEDIIVAKKEVKQKIILPPVAPPIVKAPGVRVTQRQYSTYEFDALVGRNFADDDSVIKDATSAGIRLNRYITEDFAIQLGYDRIFDADYKFISNKTHSLRSIPACRMPSCDDNSENTNGGNSGGDNSNGDQNGGNGSGGGDENQNDSGTGGSSDNPLSNLGTKKVAKDTDIDRFYLNGLKEIHLKDNSFIPYMFAGIGYEHVNDKSLDIESQGFFNAGGGLKYSLDKNLRVVSEAKVIKKFKDNNLDIVAMLGLGVLFGQKVVTIENDQTTDEKILPQAQVRNDKAPELTDKTTSYSSPIPTAVITPDETEIELMIENAQEENQNLLDDEKMEFKSSFKEDKNENVYFIQVAVVSKEKSLNNYLAKIRSNNLSYEIKPVSITNPFTRRVLVGPYLSKLDAQLDMPIVKEEIEKKAFIKTFSR